MKDKVIVITGASAGIGAAVAEEVAKRGAKPVLAARRQEVLAPLAAKLGGLAVPTDVTHRDQVERLRDRALEAFGTIDVWINNAGRAIWQPVSELTDSDLDTMVTENVKSVLYGIQAVLPHFKQQRRGHIISLSSVLSRLPFVPRRSAYSAAKAAINALMAHLRFELQEGFSDIKCTTVLCGLVATELGVHALHGGVDNRKLPNAQSPEEVARVIADAIEHPRAEVYTRPQMRDLTARYFSLEDLTVIESQPPFRTP